MPPVYRTRNERERFLIREFVEYLGYAVSRPRYPDRSDALLTVSKERQKKRIAIEHTDHYHDVLAGDESPLSPIADFWRPGIRVSFGALAVAKISAAFWEP